MHIHVVVHPIHVLYVLLLVQILSSHVQRGTDPAGRLDRSKARQVHCDALSLQSHETPEFRRPFLLIFFDTPLGDGAPHARVWNLSGWALASG